MIVSKKIIVIGKVQGVFFRKYTKEKCLELGLLGYVKNLGDGSVFIQVQGEISAVGELINWCKIGSPKSNVTNVRVEEIEPSSFRNFEIRW